MHDSLLRKLPGPPSRSFLLGNMHQLMDRKGWDFHKSLALDYGKIFKIYGPFNTPIVCVSDPVALQSMLGKDGQSWEQFYDLSVMFHVLFGPVMASERNEVHRRQRKALNPAFSPANIRAMLPIFYNVLYKVNRATSHLGCTLVLMGFYAASNALSSHVGEEPVEIDMYTWLGRTSLELIGQGGLGYSFDPLVADAADDYAKSLKAVVPVLTKLCVVRQLLPLLSRIGPSWLPRCGLDLLPSASARKLVAIINIMANRSKENFYAKKRALEKGDDAAAMQIGHGKDIMSVLIKANMATSEKDKLPEDQLVSQMSTIILAGMDTTTDSLSRALELLAQYPDVQEKLRAEILEAGSKGDPTYNQLLELPYLNAVCCETLRIDPPGVVIFRTATRDTVIPVSQPICATDGSLIKELPVAKGTHVMLGILASNISTDLWGDDALEWKPERVYFNIMTFVGGPRSCIGFKFAELAMTVVLYTLVSNFKFELTDKPIHMERWTSALPQCKLG